LDRSAIRRRLTIPSHMTLMMSGVEGSLSRRSRWEEIALRAVQGRGRGGKPYRSVFEG
jgi:hypothetical protein